MIPRSIILILAATVAFAVAQAAPQDQGAVIEGVAFRASTMQPVKNATLTLTGVQQFSATSDREGRFSIKGVPPGSYTATLERDGYYFPSDMPATRRLTVAAQEHVQLSFPLIAGGVIVGRLLTPEGRPLVNITVTANYVAGARAGSAKTNDRGEYRLFWLRPGDYYVTAAAPDRDAVGSFASPKDQYVSTLFPGAADRAAGKAISVREGAETPADAFSIQTPPTRAITIAGKADAIATFLIPHTENATVRRGGGDSSGRFQFRAVAAGVYDLLSTINLTFPERARAGLITVTAEAADLVGLSIPLSPATDLHGRIVWSEDVSAAMSERLSQLRIEVRPAKTFADLLPTPASVPVNASGDFRIPAVFQGRYIVSVGSLPAGVIVKDLRAHGRSIAPDNLAINGTPPVPLEIVLTAATAKE